MQEKQSPVFVIATANKVDALPPEFLRKGRFDEIFFVDLPTRSERRDIWRLHLTKRLADRWAGAKLPITDDLLDYLADASEGYSGAEIEQCVVAALFDAFSQRRQLAEDDVARAVTNMVPLSTTQAEQISAIRSWATNRAVAATASQDRAGYQACEDEAGPPDAAASSDAGQPAGGSDTQQSLSRGGRMVDF